MEGSRMPCRKGWIGSNQATGMIKARAGVSGQGSCRQNMLG